MDSNQINQEEAERLLAKLDQNGKTDDMLQAYAEQARKSVKAFCEKQKRWPDCHEIREIIGIAHSEIFDL